MGNAARKQRKREGTQYVAPTKVATPRADRTEEMKRRGRVTPAQQRALDRVMGTVMEEAMSGNLWARISGRNRGKG